MNLGKYEITGVIRHGRTGNVYEAQDGTLKRKVSIRRFSHNSATLTSPEYLEKFKAHTSQLATLQHPNILNIFDTGSDAEGPYIVSAAQEGYLLSEHLHHVSTLHEYDVYQMAQQLLDAIISAHSLEIMHGALSLRSLLVKEKGYGGYLFKLIDLGLNSLIFDHSDPNSLNLADFTIIAPELFDDFTPTVQSDLYSIGQLCYVSLIGGHPNAGADREATKTYQQTGQLPHISSYVQINPQLAEWIHNLMGVEPDTRPDSAADALRALSRIRVAPSHLTSPVQTAAPVDQQAPQQQTVQFQFK